MIKKTRAHPRADQTAKADFQQKIIAYEAAHRAIIDLDESGFAKEMPRCFGDALRGQRCDGTHDWQAKGRTHGIGALDHNRLLTVALFDGHINSEVFHAWTVHERLPKLPAQAVIVRDHATFHKRQDTQHALREAGHTIEYLPPYAPELNPIEHQWAQAKALRRKLQCNIDSLFRHPSL